MGLRFYNLYPDNVDANSRLSVLASQDQGAVTILILYFIFCSKGTVHDYLTV